MQILQEQKSACDRGIKIEERRGTQGSLMRAAIVKEGKKES
jgi:hypothetical protein